MKHLFFNIFTINIFIIIKSIYLEIKERKKNLKIGFSSYITNCKFGQYNTIQNNVKLRGVTLGDFSYIANNSSIIKTKIGKFCSIGSNCNIVLGKHPTKDFVSTHPAFFSTSKKHQVSFVDEDLFEEFEEVIIGNDVWIGTNVIILDGISIADGAIIAAGSVVVKNVKAYSIVGGVPAKEIKYRFKIDEIDFLLKLKWWDKDINWIKNNSKYFGKVKNLLERSF